MLNIQTLFYRIGASNQEFKQKMSESKSKLQEFDDRTKDNIRTLRNWSAVAGATATAVLYALNRTVQGTNQTASDIAKLSDQTGIAAEKMQALGYAAKQNNTSMETLGSSLVRMTRRLEAANQGNESYAGSYRRMGVQIHDTNGKLRATEDIFLDLADAFAVSNDENLKTQVAFDVLGQSGYDLIPLLNQGRQEIIRLAEEANRLGIVLSRENIDKFAKYDQVLVKWREGMNGVKMQVATAVVPVFSLLTEKAGDALEKFMAWARENPQIVSRSIVLGGALVALGLALGGVALGITIISTGISILKTTFGVLTNPIFLLILLSGLLYTAWEEDWGGIQTLVTGAVDTVKGKWDELVTWWEDSTIGKAVSEWWDEVKRIWDKESNLTFKDKVLNTLEITPGTKWIPGFIEKVEAKWAESEEPLSLAGKSLAVLEVIAEEIKLFFADEEKVRKAAESVLSGIMAVGITLSVAISLLKWAGITKELVNLALVKAWAGTGGSASFVGGLLSLAVPLGTLALLGGLIWFSLDNETKQSIKDEVDSLRDSIIEIWSEKSLLLPVQIVLELSKSAYNILQLVDRYFDPRTDEEIDAVRESNRQFQDSLPPGGKIGAWWRNITGQEPHPKDVTFYPDRTPTMEANDLASFLDQIAQDSSVESLAPLLAAIYRAEGGAGAEVPFGMTEFVVQGHSFTNDANQIRFEKLLSDYDVAEGTQEYYALAAKVSAEHYWRTFKQKYPEIGESVLAELSTDMQKLFIEHMGRGFSPPDSNPNWFPNVSAFFAELTEDMERYGEDSLEYFMLGVEHGVFRATPGMKNLATELMMPLTFDNPENDAMARRWGYDVVYYFMDGVRDAVAEMGSESEAEFIKLMDRWIHDKPENDEEAMTWGLDVVKWLIKGIEAGVHGSVDLAKQLFSFLGDSMMDSLRGRFPEQMAQIESLLGESFGSVELAFGEGGTFDPEAMKLKQLNDTTKQWTDNLTQGLSNAIGYGRGLEQTFQNVIGVFDNFLGMLASQFLQTKVFGPLFGSVGVSGNPATNWFSNLLTGLPIFHEGGMILHPAAYYHSGGYIGELKSDEVPIIAQTGERMLSRSQNDQFENILASISGEDNGAMHVDLTINAVDPASFRELLMRDPDLIKHLFIDDFGKNGPLRKIILQLARG